MTYQAHVHDGFSSIPSIIDDPSFLARYPSWIAAQDPSLCRKPIWLATHAQVHAKEGCIGCPKNDSKRGRTPGGARLTAHGMKLYHVIVENNEGKLRAVSTSDSMNGVTANIERLDQQGTSDLQLAQSDINLRSSRINLESVSTAPDRWRIGNAALRVLRDSFVTRLASFDGYRSRIVLRPMLDPRNTKPQRADNLTAQTMTKTETSSRLMACAVPFGSYLRAIVSSASRALVKLVDLWTFKLVSRAITEAISSGDELLFSNPQIGYLPR
ncbi:hypothetical protein KCU61_g388, partial [Aureobasidium melanogenum]